MSASHFSAEQLSQYIEGELPQAEAEQAARHLERCGRCREQLESLQRMLATLSRLPDLAPSPGFLARLEERIVARRSLGRRLADGFSLAFLPLPARAAALAVVVLLGTGMVYFSNRPSAPLDSSSALRLAKEQKSPSKRPGPATLAPQRGLGMQQEVLDEEQPAAQDRWFFGREAQELAQEEDFSGPAETPQAEAVGWEDKKTQIAAGTTVRETRAPVSTQEVERLHTLGYLYSKEEPASMPSEDSVRVREAPAAAAFGVERAEPEGIDLAFGASRAVSPEPAPPEPTLTETAAKPLSLQLGDAMSAPAEERLKQVETQATDRANQPAPARASRTAGYFSMAMEETTTRFSKGLTDRLELLVSSADPRQTAESLQAWLPEQRWSRGQPALAVEDGTAVLTVYVPADSVSEATEAILAQANRPTAGGFAGRSLDEYGRAGDYFYQRYPAAVPASPRLELQARLPEDAAVSQSASEATVARHLRKAGRAEVVAASRPQTTYREIRIRVVRDPAAVE